MKRSEVSSLVDSNTVLWGQALIYTFYVSAIMLLIAWFAIRVTREGSTRVPPKLFYTLVSVLVIIGGSLHLITYNTIPWVKDDLHGAALVADRSFELTVADHKFTLPSPTLDIECGDLVEFNVLSADLTYGFGLFRADNSMVFQMQVVPGHDNRIKWEFVDNEVLTIRSTEYSGPAGDQMIVKDAVIVTGCEA